MEKKMLETVKFKKRYKFCMDDFSKFNLLADQETIDYFLNHKSITLFRFFNMFIKLKPDMNIKNIISNNDVMINTLYKGNVSYDSIKSWIDRFKNINSKLVIFLEHMYYIFSNLEKCKINDFEYKNLLKFLRTDVKKYILTDDFISLIKCIEDFKFHDFVNTLDIDVKNNVFIETYKTCLFYDTNKRLINDIDGKIFSKIYDAYDCFLYYDWDGLLEYSKTPRKNYYTGKLGKFLIEDIINKRCLNDGSVENCQVCHEIKQIIYRVYFTRPMVTLYLLLIFSIDWNKVKKFNEFKKNIKTIKDI